MIRTNSECDSAAFGGIRKRAVLEGCKWDPQVGDIETLTNFALILPAPEWRLLSDYAELLAAEALAAETEILARPKLLDALGLPPAIKRVLREQGTLTPAAARIVRFDFHLTADGWRISEANSDVPGGYSEASYFSSLMAEQFPGLRTCGDPAGAVAAALVGEKILMLSAPGFMEDQQVTAFLGKQLAEKGCRIFFGKPDQAEWHHGRAHFHGCEVDEIFRFFQAEWLARLPEATGWKHFFRQGQTPVANPGSAIVVESKRFPLLWDQLETELPTWRKLLPETRDPRETPWRSDESWLLKRAFGNNGDAVFMREFSARRQWMGASLGALLNPNAWLAQRRFESKAISTPAGPRHVCVGIYTVNGRAAGAYGRLATKPIIDFSAVDAAILIDENE
jgi:glutathionylspermidine synthase